MQRLTMQRSGSCLTEIALQQLGYPQEAAAVIAAVDRVQGVFGVVVFVNSVNEEISVMGVFDALKQGGFKPKANEDVEFAPFKGEYKVRVSGLSVLTDKETGDKQGYTLELTVEQTISGDIVDGRKHWQRYRTQGTDWQKQPISEEAGTKALSALLNDLFTLGVTLDTSSEEALDASLSKALDAVGYMRAWHFAAKDGDKKIQQVKIKQEKDLKKGTADNPQTNF